MRASSPPSQQKGPAALPPGPSIRAGIAAAPVFPTSAAPVRYREVAILPCEEEPAYFTQKPVQPEILA